MLKSHSMGEMKSQPTLSFPKWSLSKKYTRGRVSCVIAFLRYFRKIRTWLIAPSPPPVSFSMCRAKSSDAIHSSPGRSFERQGDLNRPRNENGKGHQCYGPRGAPLPDCLALDPLREVDSLPRPRPRPLLETAKTRFPFSPLRVITILSSGFSKSPRS